MGCLLRILAAFPIRLLIIAMAIFSDYIGTAYPHWIFPLLGFFFLPYSTVAFAWAYHSGLGNPWGGFGPVLIGLGLVIDLWATADGGRTAVRYSRDPRRNVRVRG